MKAKHLLIPVAAFALTATSVSAFNPDVLRDAGLSEDQVSAFETAHELKKEGDRDAARDVLAEAGIDLDTLEEVRNAMRAEREDRRADIKAAVEAEDYDEFQLAIEGTRLEDKIQSEADFETFVEAHELRKTGNKAEAKELLSELGIEKPHGKKFGRGGDRAERSVDRQAE